MLWGSSFRLQTEQLWLELQIQRRLKLLPVLVGNTTRCSSCRELFVLQEVTHVINVPANGVTPASVVAELLKCLPVSSTLWSRLLAPVKGATVTITPAMPSDNHVCLLQGRKMDVDRVAEELNKRLTDLGRRLARYSDNFRLEGTLAVAAASPYPRLLSLRLAMQT